MGNREELLFHEKNLEDLPHFCFRVFLRDFFSCEMVMGTRIL